MQQDDAPTPQHYTLKVLIVHTAGNRTSPTHLAWSTRCHCVEQRHAERKQTMAEASRLFLHRLKRLDSTFVPHGEADDVTLDVADGG